VNLRKTTQIAAACLAFFAGLWALASLWLTVEPDSRLLPVANLLAVATCLVGVLVLTRLKFAILATIVTLAPQAISFAARNIAFALNIWPSFRIEIDVTASPIDTFVQGIRWTPQLMFRTDANYAGVGIGIDFVSIGLIFLLTWVFVKQPRASADV
jgi:hypothetical protein